MATINRRIAASIEGDFVVFIIGTRFNRWWKLPRDLWFFSTMPKMLAEVAAKPESGFLGWEPLSLTTNVQYWRSLERLTAYSRNRDQTHYPYWVKFNKEIGSNGDIGIWHETSPSAARQERGRRVLEMWAATCSSAGVQVATAGGRCDRGDKNVSIRGSRAGVGCCQSLEVGGDG